ncbi:MAG: glycoside hydrolase family 18 protein [Candidatus Kryptoniota bacterium]
MEQRWNGLDGRSHSFGRKVRSHKFIVGILFVVLTIILVSAASEAQTTKPWVTAYYGGWELGDGGNGYLPVSDVDFTAITDVVHFCLVPKADGTLDSTGNGISRAGSAALVKAAHAAGTKVLISVGGAYTEPGFVGATSSENLNKFVYNLVGFMVQRKYDGIDIDWEPINPQDYEQFKIFVSTLRGVIGQHYLLTTTAVQGYGPLMASMQNYFDQINIMTYDLSFPSQGWITWYSGALYQNGVTFPSTGGPLPACDNIVSTFISAGVVRNKIGIGIEFGGSIWKGGLTSDGKGVTGPGQSWEVAPTIIPDVPYYIIMRDYYSPERYHWDQGAQSSYLSIDSASAVKDYFISYDDAKDISAKITYVKKNNLGGVIIYELGMGYLGKGKNPLLDAVKAAASPLSPRGESSNGGGKK